MIIEVTNTIITMKEKVTCKARVTHKFLKMSYYTCIYIWVWSNPNDPVVIVRIAILTSSSDSADRGRSIIRVRYEVEEYFIDQLKTHKGHSNYNDWQYGLQTYNVHNNNKEILRMSYNYISHHCNLFEYK